MAFKQSRMLGFSTTVGDQNGNQITDRLEVKAGHIKQVIRTDSRERRKDVFVRVYRSQFEHYAVVYQNKVFCKACAFINLKSCVVSVDLSVRQIIIRPYNDDGIAVVLEADQYTVESWIDAFSLSTMPVKGSLSPLLSPVIPRSPTMQTLLESEEEEDD